MFRITASPGAGSSGPRVFLSEAAPKWRRLSPTSRDRVLTFVGSPVARVMRLPEAEVQAVHQSDDGNAWEPVDMGIKAAPEQKPAAKKAAKED